MRHQNFDLVICGAGVSGLYAAWRLSANKALKIAVVESNPQIGGRILSLALESPDNFIELGAMRHQSNQAHIQKLIKILNLKTVPVPELEKQYFALRENQITSVEKMKWGQGYHLAPDFRDKDPNQILKLIDSKHPNPLGLGYHDLLASVLPAEALKLCIDADGYDSNFRNSNATEGFQYHQRHNDPKLQSRRFFPNNEELPKSLLKNTGKQVQILLNHSVKKVSQEPSGFRVHLSTVDSKETILQCQQIISSIPPGALLQVELPANLQSAVTKLSANLITEQASKIVFVYTDCWWQSLNIESGRLISDGPLRNILFSKRGRENCITIYNEQPLAKFTSDQKIIEFLKPQLDKILKLESPIPDRIEKKCWQSSSSRSAYHSWQANTDVEKLSELALQPLNSQSFFMCGEAFSRQQSWMEGAIESTDRMLVKHFHMKALLDDLSQESLSV